MIEKNGMKSDQIIMVSAGMLSPKKENDRLNKQNLYPNYGLVSLATVLKSKGYSPVVIHGDFKDPQEIIELLKFYRANRSAYPILLSIPSFFALEWAQIFCEEVAKHFSGKKIVVGGKWVVNGNETWLKTKLKGISSFKIGRASCRERV